MENPGESALELRTLKASGTFEILICNRVRIVLKKIKKSSKAR